MAELQSEGNGVMCRVSSVMTCCDSMKGGEGKNRFLLVGFCGLSSGQWNIWQYR